MKTESLLIVGIDWSRNGHQINLLNEQGQSVVRFRIDHSYQGFAKLDKKLTEIGDAPGQILVAIETDHNQLVDFLYAKGYTIYIIPPSVVKGNRSRQSHAGAKNDSKDAELLADIVRTDRERMVPWQPDGAVVKKVRVQLRLIDDLTAAIIQGRNRLEAQLLRFFPQATDIFSDLTTQIALKLLIQYPTPSAIATIDLATFRQFCAENGYAHRSQIGKRFARLHRPNPFPHYQSEAVYGDTVPLLAQRLLSDVQLKAALIKALQAIFHTHPDAEIYTSIPGSGQLLAPKLLAVFGDHRTRYPTPDSLRALAGTCPATSQSGKKRGVFFRKACNKEWRNTFQQLAKASLATSDWAATYFENVRLRGKKKGQAYRSLANRWVGIIWTLWQRHELYNEAIHLQNVHWFKRNSSKAP